MSSPTQVEETGFKAPPKKWVQFEEDEKTKSQSERVEIPPQQQQQPQPSGNYISDYYSGKKFLFYAVH